MEQHRSSKGLTTCTTLSKLNTKEDKLNQTSSGFSFVWNFDLGSQITRKGNESALIAKKLDLRHSSKHYSCYNELCLISFTF